MNNFVNKHIKWVFPSCPYIYDGHDRGSHCNDLPVQPERLESADGNGMRFNWGKNYLDVLASRILAVLRIIYYTAIATVAEMLLGLAIALSNAGQGFWGKNGAKAVVLLPYMMAPVAVGLMWMLFYEPSSGLLNLLFHNRGTSQVRLCVGQTDRYPCYRVRWRRGR